MQPAATTNKKHAEATLEQKEIEKLIELENDPQIRLQLMIMNRINLSLITNTETIHEIGDKLEEHLTNYDSRTKIEDEILNKGKGAWKVIAWIVAAVQTVGIVIWNDVRSNLNSFQEQLVDNKYVHAIYDLRLKKLEDYHIHGSNGEKIYLPSQDKNK